MTRTRLTALALLSLIVAGGEACADLPSVDRGTCGNRVVDGNEECDTFAGAGERCRRPDEANACRFDCAKDVNGVAARCPTGYACNSSDFVCRKPSGTFRPAISFEANADRLAIGDFDGDGRDDVLAMSSTDEFGRGSVRAFFFDDPSQAPKLTTIPATTVSPIAHDMDDDGRSDLVFDTFAIGANVLLGQPARTFTAMAFSRFRFPPGATARLVRVLGAKPNPAFGVPLIFFEPEAGRTFVARPRPEGNPKDYAFAALTKAPSAIVGVPVAANIVQTVKATAHPCTEVIWAWKGEGSLNWIQPCSDDGFILPQSPPAPPMTLGPEQKLLSLPAGATIDKPPAHADLNGDDKVDLLITAEVSDGTKAVRRLFVAFGRGNGSFSGSPTLDPAVTTSVAVVGCQAPSPKDRVLEPFSCNGALAAGLSAGRAVIALPNAVVALDKIVDRPTGGVIFEVTPLAARLTGEWTSALIGDLNANNFIDVAAASKDAPDIDFFNGTPYGVLNPSKIPTSGPVSWLSSGDYDGDLIADLAFVEAGVGSLTLPPGGGPPPGGPPTGDAGADSEPVRPLALHGVSVAYGRYSASPDRPLRMGEFPGVLQMGSANLGGVNAVDQLGVIYEKESDQIAVLEGSGDRQLLSPFGFAAPGPMGKMVQSAPFMNLAGRFLSGTPGASGRKPADLITIGYDHEDNRLTGLRAWIAGGAGDGRLLPPAYSDPILAFDLANRDQTKHDSFIARAAAADLDGNGIDEGVILGVRRVPVDKPVALAGVLSIVRATAGMPPGLDVKTLPALPKAAMFKRMDLVLADLNQDHKIDAVVGLYSDEETTVLIAWGNGTDFDTKDAKPVALEGRVKGMTRLDGGVAIVTERGVFALKGAHGTPSRIPSLSYGPAALQDATAIATGDFNADGIADFALAGDHRIHVSLGEATRP